MEETVMSRGEPFLMRGVGFGYGRSPSAADVISGSRSEQPFSLYVPSPEAPPQATLANSLCVNPKSKDIFHPFFGTITFCLPCSVFLPPTPPACDLDDIIPA